MCNCRGGSTTNVSSRNVKTLGNTKYRVKEDAPPPVEEVTVSKTVEKKNYRIIKKTSR